MKENEQIVTRFVEELWNERKLEVADIIFDENCHTHQLQSGSPMIATARGPAAVKAHVTHGLLGFPISRAIDFNGQALARMIIDDIQHAHGLSACCTIAHEIHRLPFVGMHRSCQNQPVSSYPVLTPPTSQAQTFFAIEPMNPLVIGMPPSRFSSACNRR